MNFMSLYGWQFIGELCKFALLWIIYTLLTQITISVFMRTMLHIIREHREETLKYERKYSPLN